MIDALHLVSKNKEQYIIRLGEREFRILAPDGYKAFLKHHKGAIFLITINENELPDDDMYFDYGPKVYFKRLMNPYCYGTPYWSYYNEMIEWFRKKGN